MSNSATQKIKQMLVDGLTISPAEAFAVFGIVRLGSVIHVLRNKGMNIETTMRKDTRGHTYARYSLK